MASPRADTGPRDRTRSASAPGARHTPAAREANGRSGHPGGCLLPERRALSRRSTGPVRCVGEAAAGPGHTARAACWSRGIGRRQDRASADLRAAGRAAGASVARRPDGRSRWASAAGRSLADHLLRRDNGAERSSEGRAPRVAGCWQSLPIGDGGLSQKPGIGRNVGKVATQLARDRCRDRIQRLSGSALDGESVQREAVADLQRVIGFDRWCVPQADPDTLLPGVGIADHDYGPGLPRALELEYSGTDFAAKRDVARRARLASSLVAETGGDLARSPRWDEVLRPVGIGDIAAVACRDASGCWGWIEAYRDASERAFSDDDLDLLGAAGVSMSVPLRRSIVDVRREDPAASEPPGDPVSWCSTETFGRSAAPRRPPDGSRRCRWPRCSSGGACCRR